MYNGYLIYYIAFFYTDMSVECSLSPMGLCYIYEYFNIHVQNNGQTLSPHNCLTNFNTSSIDSEHLILVK